jgi:hypothetical protein
LDVPVCVHVCLCTCVVCVYPCGCIPGVRAPVCLTQGCYLSTDSVGMSSGEVHSHLTRDWLQRRATGRRSGWQIFCCLKGRDITASERLLRTAPAWRFRVQELPVHLGCSSTESQGRGVRCQWGTELTCVLYSPPLHQTTSSLRNGAVHELGRCGSRIVMPFYKASLNSRAQYLRPHP